MADLVYPTSIELKEIAQQFLPRLARDREIFKIMPMVEVDQAYLAWEQLDNFKGLMQFRGYNGQPATVAPTGQVRYLVAPGVYGEQSYIDEKQITERRKIGTFDQPIDISDLTAIETNKLTQRALDRMEWIGWTLLTGGSFSVLDTTGAVAHTDSYPIRQYTAAVGWGTPATATPLADLRAVKLLRRGYSVDFSRAPAYANSTTVNKMLSNTNSADLYGRRVTGLATANNLTGVNSLYMNDGLPNIVEFDDGYYDDNGVFHLFIPDNKVVVVGNRPAGQPVADFAMTRNASNPGAAPGMYFDVIDDFASKGPPRSVSVHCGFNGGPRIYFPSAVILMNV